TKSVSNLISGVKNFESHTVSLLRGLAFIQVQSAKAKGTDLAGFSGLVAGGADVDWSCGGAGPAAAAVSAGVGAGSVAFARPTGVSVVAPGAFSSISSSSMRAFITVSSLAMSVELA